MRPYKILIFLLSIAVVLSFLSIIFPKEGIYIGNNLILRFPDLESVLQSKESQMADISEILEYSQAGMAADDEILIPDTIMSLNDSIYPLPDSLRADFKSDSIPFIDSVQSKKNAKLPGDIRRALEYPNNNKAVLHPFFDHLRNLKNSGELIRILHYGDSQIEGDRISSYFRNELQKQFGGSGIGLFAPVLIKGTNISVQHQLEGSWTRYTLHSIKNGNIYHKRLGALMSFGRFAPTGSSENVMFSGEINLKKSNQTYLRTRKFKQLRIFYGYNNRPFITELKYKDKTLDAELISPSYQLNVLSWNLDNALNEITISFKGDDSPDIYGIALDDFSGIAVDNIPLRGSSGTDFTRTDLAFLRSMYQQLNVKLIIFQFGVNMIPYVIDDYSYYEKQFYKQLKTLKDLRPDICIIVIGVSDMSRKNKGQLESYPNIKKIRVAQKNAARKAGCVFWDTFEAMGGTNSMPAWVNAKPPLANKDYTHFTWKGSVVMARMFYEALMTDYNTYVEKVKNKEK